MLKTIQKRLLCLMLMAVMLIPLCACAQKSPEQTAIPLENGWYMGNEAPESLKKGFESTEAPLALSQLTLKSDTAVYYSNTFTAALEKEKGDSVVLDIYDTLGNITLYLNGEEVIAFDSAEGKYSFDITKQIKKSGSNTLVIYAVPTENGTLVSPGGMMDISVRKPVSISEVYTVSDTEAQTVTAYAVINNTTETEAQVSLGMDISSIAEATQVVSVTKTVTAPVGESTAEVVFDASNLTKWSNINPYLYLLSAKLQDEEGNIASYSDYVGYRSFEVKDGYFYLNGERILIKGANITKDESYGNELNNILNYIKTAGFNTVHVADGAAAGRLLEYCDRLGLLVYEGVGENAHALAKRDRAHISLVMADGDDEALAAWREANAQAVVIGESGASNIGSDAFDAKLNVAKISAANGADKEALKAISALSEGSFITSVGVSGLKDNEIDLSAVSDWYEGYNISQIMAIGEIDEKTNLVNTNENAALLSALRAKNVSGFCFTTDISRYKTAVTETINDGINDLRFCITADKTNIYNTDSININIALSNFDVLTKGSYDVEVKISGDDGTVYTKTVSFSANNTFNGEIFNETMPLKDYKAGKYVISAEVLDGAHPVCNEKTILIHEKESLAKLSGNVYIAGTDAAVKTLLEEQGANVAQFTGTAKSGDTVIVADESLLQKAMASGANVVILNAQNCESLPVAGEIISGEYTAVLYSNELTSGMVNTAVLYEPSVCGNILSDSYFASENEATYALSAYSANADGSIGAGALFAAYEVDGKTVTVSTLNFDVSNPYAAILLINSIKEAK